MPCATCILSGFCKRWLVVGDNDLTNQRFIQDARSYIRAWMLERGGFPRELPTLVLDEFSHLNGEFRNGAWIRVRDDYERLFESADETILFDAHRAASERASLVEWLNEQFGRNWPEDRPTFFQRDPKNERRFAFPGERFRWLASRVRAMDWHDNPTVRYWGERTPVAVNDNQPDLRRGAFDPRD
jgi:hypothetical protein